MPTTAFPVSQPNVLDTFKAFQGAAQQVQSLCTSVSQASGNVPAQEVLNLLNQSVALNAMVTTLNASQALVTAMLAFLPTMFPTLVGLTAAQIQANFAASVAALQALITAISSDLPTDSGGFLQVQNLQSSVPTMTNYAPAQLSRTLPAITAFLATVD